MPLSEDLRPCTVCGEPVLWGTRHPICGQRVMAIEAANARVRWALSAIVKALDALGEHSNLVRLGVQALADQCDSCKGSGSDGYHGCTDCLGTGVDQHSASEVLEADARGVAGTSPESCYARWERWNDAGMARLYKPAHGGDPTVTCGVQGARPYYCSRCNRLHGGECPAGVPGGHTETFPQEDADGSGRL